MKNLLATLLLFLFTSNANAQQQKLPGNLYYLGDELTTTSIADKLIESNNKAIPEHLDCDEKENLVGKAVQLISSQMSVLHCKRDVSERTKKEVKKRDGGCCLVCGSTYQLEVDHRIALMNGGDNSKDNLGTLCDSCHNKKTRLDYKIRKRRQQEAGTR